LSGGRIFIDRATVGDVEVFQVAADPNGSLTAPKGSFAFLSAGVLTASVFLNLDGGTTWRNLTAAASVSEIPPLSTVSTTLLAPDSGPGAALFPTSAVVVEDGDYNVFINGFYQVTGTTGGTVPIGFIVETSLNGVRLGTLVPAPTGDLTTIQLMGFEMGNIGGFNATLFTRLNGLVAGDAVNAIFGHVVATSSPLLIIFSTRQISLVKVQ